MKHSKPFGAVLPIVSVCAGIVLSLFGNKARGDPWFTSVLGGAAIGSVVAFFLGAAVAVSRQLMDRKPVFSCVSLFLVIAVCVGGSSLICTHGNLPVSAAFTVFSELAGLRLVFRGRSAM
ncbi:MAG: hypothetical protein BWY39_02006 [Spirochaetes bacterium ADurb.Bin269]|nr:MAG: hypothetical protein BWY39_02006 [Spirochaetes bacterium ADurb.Bin269]